MKYALLTYEDESKVAKMNEAERGALFQAYAELHAALVKEGLYAGGEGLLPTSTAASITVRGGAAERTAGPAVSTGPHALTGFFIVNAKDDTDAARIAARIPAAATGRVEIRPVLAM